MSVLIQIDKITHFVSIERYFPAIVSCEVYKISDMIEDELSKEQISMVRKTQFHLLLDLDLLFDGQLVHHEKKSDTKFQHFGDESNIYFRRFLTGLWSFNGTVERATSGERLQYLLFRSMVEERNEKEKEKEDLTDMYVIIIQTIVCYCDKVVI